MTFQLVPVLGGLFDSEDAWVALENYLVRGVLMNGDIAAVERAAGYSLRADVLVVPEEAGCLR